MGSRCHDPFGDGGGVRAHLLSMPAARTPTTTGAYSVASEGRCSLPSGTARIVAAPLPEGTQVAQPCSGRLRLFGRDYRWRVFKRGLVLYEPSLDSRSSKEERVHGT